MTWPLWGRPEDPEQPRCSKCGAPVPTYASYCEACGTTLEPTQAPPQPEPDAAAEVGSSVTRRLGQRVSAVAHCPQCGGTIDSDGYCQSCGVKAPDPRDHVELSAAGWVAGTSDLGMVHSRNEDALALWVDGDAPRAVLVVCDGVSTSTDAHIASLAAAECACELLTDAVRSDADLPTSFREAVLRANDAIIAHTAPDMTNAPSATFAAAVVDGDRLGFATLGDSRVYWIGDDAQELLSTDDSMAQQFIAQGMPRDAAEAMPQAHAITKWLGRDAVELEPDIGVHRLTASGWVLVCSDGLWNYASAPAVLAALVRDQEAADPAPEAIARGLVAWANQQGGHDNVTVALARHPATGR